MTSINAKNVAKEVSENVRKGKLVKLGAIMRKNGYSKQTSLKPKRVTDTKSFKDEIEPVVDAMERERNKAIVMMKKKISKAKYRDLVDAVDKFTKNIQLLGGKDTGKVTFTWEK